MKLERSVSSLSDLQRGELFERSFMLRKFINNRACFISFIHVMPDLLP